MAPKVLIDADALFAFISPLDPHYNKAQVLRNKISQEEVLLAVTTLAEVVTTLGRKLNRKVSLGVLDYVREGGFNLIAVDEELMILAEDYYRRQASKKNTFFDCLNMAVAKSYGVDFIFSFDRGYELNGFKLLGNG